MIGILLLTHCGLGRALLDCVRHVTNSLPPRSAWLDVGATDDPGSIGRQARELLEQLDEGAGVLILTDIYGATPANIAARLRRPGHVEVVAGVNVPMLLRVLTYREKSDIDTLCRKAVSGGCEGVHQIKGSF